jgi:redox-regulated HSP33 family molecular chaperone
MAPQTVREIMKRAAKDKNQVREFRKAARELGCDESEERFRQALRTLGKKKSKLAARKRATG